MGLRSGLELVENRNILAVPGIERPAVQLADIPTNLSTYFHSLIIIPVWRLIN
jgi:hypothetical protein